MLLYDSRTLLDYTIVMLGILFINVMLLRRIKKFGGKYLRGYNNCVSAFVKKIDQRFVSLKEKISKIMTDGSDNNFWGRRPIPEARARKFLQLLLLILIFPY